MNERRIPRALTIAGSDSGGGAGIEADLKTFTVHGVYGMAAVTAITAQNTVGVRAVYDLPAELVAEQIDAVAEDLGVDAAKSGMLSSAGIVEAVAECIERHGIRNLVVDPVMVAKSGDVLLQEEARGTGSCGGCSRWRRWSPRMCPKRSCLRASRFGPRRIWRRRRGALRALGRPMCW